MHLARATFLLSLPFAVDAGSELLNTQPIDRAGVVSLMLPSASLLASNNSLLNPSTLITVPATLMNSVVTTTGDVAADVARRFAALRSRLLASHQATLNARSSYLQTTQEAASQMLDALFPSDEPGTLGAALSELAQLPVRLAVSPLNLAIDIEQYLKNPDMIPTLPPEPQAAPCVTPGTAMKLETSVSINADGSLHVEASEPEIVEGEGDTALATHTETAPPPPDLSRLDEVINALPVEGMMYNHGPDGAPGVFTKAEADEFKAKMREEMKKKLWDEWVEKLVAFHLGPPEPPRPTVASPEDLFRTVMEQLSTGGWTKR